MDIAWCRIVSYHALRPHDPFGPTTYCGRDAEGREVVDNLLLLEKSCESCLRIVARLQDDDEKAD